MENRLKVVLADRNRMYLQKLKISLERKGNIVVVGTADNGSDVITLLEQFQPDVLLTDISLNGHDGFWVLERMQTMNHKCISVVISSVDGDSVVRKAITLGAEYYMIKPIQGEMLMDRMYQLLGVKDSKAVEVSRAREDVGSPEKTQIQTDAEMETEIAVILSRMGVPASVKGYHFVRSAILMVINKPMYLNGITKSLYPDIAKNYQTSSSRVERAIRHAIETGWKKNAIPIYFEVTGCVYDKKPTNGSFIASMAEYIKGISVKSA